MSNSQLASKPTLNLLLRAKLPLPTLPRCAEAAAFITGKSAARDASRKARACRSADLAPETLVLDCNAWPMSRASSGSPKRNHHSASDEPALAEERPPIDQSMGIFTAAGGARGGVSDAQPHTASIKMLTRLMARMRGMLDYGSEYVSALAYPGPRRRLVVRYRTDTGLEFLHKGTSSIKVKRRNCSVALSRRLLLIVSKSHFNGILGRAAVRSRLATGPAGPA